MSIHGTVTWATGRSLAFQGACDHHADLALGWRWATLGQRSLAWQAQLPPGRPTTQDIPPTGPGPVHTSRAKNTTVKRPMRFGSRKAGRRPGPSRACEVQDSKTPERPGSSHPSHLDICSGGQGYSQVRDLWPLHTLMWVSILPSGHQWPRTPRPQISPARTSPALPCNHRTQLQQ